MSATVITISGTIIIISATFMIGTLFGAIFTIILQAWLIKKGYYFFSKGKSNAEEDNMFYLRTDQSGTSNIKNLPSTLTRTEAPMPITADLSGIGMSSHIGKTKKMTKSDTGLADNIDKLGKMK